MSSSRLHLKRTPAEQAEREARKIRKEARRRARRAERAGGLSSEDECRYSEGGSGPGPKTQRSRDNQRRRTRSGSTSPVQSQKRRRNTDFSSSYREADADVDPALKEEAYRRLEEQRFREKMLDALADDCMDGTGFGPASAAYRADQLESEYRDETDFMPRRWGGSRGGAGDIYGRGMRSVYSEDEGLGEIDPNMMTDEEYAAWLRRGMYEKQHASEIAAQKRRAEERAARKQRERILREETNRLTREAEKERNARKSARAMRRAEEEERRLAEARAAYDERWKALLAGSTPVATKLALRFQDVPWPVFLPFPPPSIPSETTPTPVPSPRVALTDLTAASIAHFLLPPSIASDDKVRRDKLRETLLRFHPDKFDSKVGSRIALDVGLRERSRAIEAAGIVVRVVNDLLKNGI